MKQIFLLFLLLPLFVSAQLMEDFADGNFTANPVWHGDSLEFQISTYSNSAWSQYPRLQLDGSVADTSYLYTSSVMPNLDDKQWEFWVRLAFSTSKTNNCRVYIVSDNSNLEGSLNGYYVMFGDDNDDGLDSISLWKQTGITVQKIIAGQIIYTGASSNYRIKVTRDNTGNWELFADQGGTFNFVSVGTANDNTYNSSAYFGVFCKYTLSNKTYFYFDDIYAGPAIVDTVKPGVQAVTVTSATQLDVLFTENVKQITAENAGNYMINSFGLPVSATRDATDASLVHLVFSSPFTEGVVYLIDIANVEDLSGNVILPVSTPFSYYNGAPFDIVFNEIMADPDPPLVLPNCEYLELYNRTQIPINLKNWTVTIGTNIQILPEINILPDSFLIIAGNSAVPLLSVYGTCVGLSSFALTNSGTSLMLKNKSGEIIHFITYTDSWYRDADKMDGGWSIEQIDPNNPCGEADNWKASIDNSRGTPGRKNSVFFPNPDTLLPYIKNIRVINENKLEVIFNETLINTTASDTSNYFVNNSIGKPVTVTLTEPDKKIAVLTFADTIQKNIIYSLTFTDTITDCAGNHSVNISKSFARYDVKPFDIVINEIMADPDPPVGLPNLEYLELYNKTVFPISLSGYKICLSGSNKNIPNISIEPKGYLIITDEGNTPSFKNYGQVAEVSGFSLANTGQVVMLLDSLYHAISLVSYTDKWYQNTTKDEGGWSLEQIDPLNPCGEKSNWKASADPSGGTPGKVNSINAGNPDLLSPLLIRASASRYLLNRVKIYFNEIIDSVSMKDVTKYIVSDSIGNPYMMRLVYPDNRCGELYFTQNFQKNIIYTLTVTDSIFDCVGNKIATNQSVKFAIPETPDTADLVINEILADPKDGGVDFVEIYNRSNKVLDFMDLNLLSLTDSAIITSDNFLIFPGNYTVLTTNPDAVKSQYFTPNPYAFIAMESFPSLNNDEGTAILSTNTDTIIDAMSYTSDMQFPLLNSTNGVSLERVSYDRPASDITNWHSAAETVGFATPAYLNSQFMATTDDDGTVSVSPEIFSPDNDGYNDVLNIYCKTDSPGKMLNITIYDSKGRLIKYLIKNQLMSAENVYSWDGINDNNQKANIGIYVIYVEILDMKGNVKHYKKTAVLATKL